MPIRHAIRSVAMVASIVSGAGAALGSTPTDIGTQMHNLSDGVAQVSRKGPAAVAQYLSRRAIQLHLTALFLIDSKGHVLLSVTGLSAPAYIAPDLRTLAGAKTGQVVELAPFHHMASALMKLGALNDAYLLVVRPL